MVAHR